MIKEKSKFEFVSDEWVEQARMILEDFKKEHQDLSGRIDRLRGYL